VPGQPVPARLGHAKLGQQLPGRGARGGILSQAPFDQGPQLGRHVTEGRGAVDHAVQQRRRRSAPERRPAGRRVGQDAAQAEDVGRRTYLVAFGLLRRHEARRAHDAAGVREPGRVGRAGDAEVNDARSVAGQEHVGRLEVAVHDAGRMDSAQPGGKPGRERAHGLDRQRPEGSDSARQRRTGYVCGYQPGLRSIRIGIDNWCRENAADSPGRRDFLCESAPEIEIIRQFGPDQFYRDHLSGWRLGQVYPAHTARAQQVQQTVLPYLLRVPRLKPIHDARPPCIQDDSNGNRNVSRIARAGRDPATA
jgi:hypothetical protein